MLSAGERPTEFKLFNLLAGSWLPNGNSGFVWFRLFALLRFSYLTAYKPILGYIIPKFD